MAEAASEFLLGDVGDEAEMGSGDAEGAVKVEGGEIAVVPGTAEEGGEEAVGGEAGGVDACREPEWVDAFEEVDDEIPASAFAGFAGIADEDDEEVEGVAGGLDHAVGAGADEVAEGGQELKEDGGGVGF